jgi:hypothetical protein
MMRGLRGFGAGLVAMMLPVVAHGATISGTISRMQPSPVPEPPTLVMVVTGLFGIGAVVGLRQRKAEKIARRAAPMVVPKTVGPTSDLHEVDGFVTMSYSA